MSESTAAESSKKRKLETPQDEPKQRRWTRHRNFKDLSASGVTTENIGDAFNECSLDETRLVLACGVLVAFRDDWVQLLRRFYKLRMPDFDRLDKTRPQLEMKKKISRPKSGQRCCTAILCWEEIKEESTIANRPDLHRTASFYQAHWLSYGLSWFTKVVELGLPNARQLFEYDLDLLEQMQVAKTATTQANSSSSHPIPPLPVTAPSPPVTAPPPTSTHALQSSSGLAVLQSSSTSLPLSEHTSDAYLKASVKHMKVDLTNENVLPWEELCVPGNIKTYLEELAEETLMPLGFAESWEPEGTLLYGPGGTGKTSLAYSFAKKFGLVFFEVGGSEIKGKLIGESEKLIRIVFEQARSHQPCVLFFDEIDAIFRKPMATDSGHLIDLQMKIKQEWSTLMRINAKVFIFGATNSPWDLSLSGGLRRCFSNFFYIGPPDLECTLQIIRSKLKTTPCNISADEEAVIGQRLHSEGCTGADIRRLLARVRRNLSAEIHKATSWEMVTFDDTACLVPSINSMPASGPVRRFFDMGVEEKAMVRPRPMTQAAVLECLDGVTGIKFMRTVKADELKRYAEFREYDEDE